MNLDGRFNNKLMTYMLNTLAALGLMVFIMCLFVILQVGLNMSDFTAFLSNLKVWGFICGYALATTMLIDLVTYKWRPISFQVSVLLHGLAGFLVFFPLMGMNFYSVIAGSVGAVCALIYVFGSRFLKKKKQYIWIFLFVFPLLLGIRGIDFTVKEEWIEEKTPTSFSAEFERFDGKNEIPIPLKKGEVLTCTLSFSPMNEGGYGYHVLNDKGGYVGMQELDEEARAFEESDKRAFKFNAEEDGFYLLVVTGDQLKGKIDVTWVID